MRHDRIPPPRRITRAEIEHALRIDHLRRRTAEGDGGAAFTLLAFLPEHEVYAALSAALTKEPRHGA
ncbi:hypothetical protein ACKI16_23685 [Streptomyces scabiei]|uniref:hypothetical protein n=1 Tax=Streptomyces scabiei TaxID=1930 RepID=UPI0038F727A4